MEISVQRHANVSKQATLLERLDIRSLKWFVHEGMNDICKGSFKDSHWKFKYKKMNY